MTCLRILVLTLLAMLTASGDADDWPQWMGPQRDGVWRESGIVDTFSDEGPPTVWSAPVELGYSGPAVAEGRVFVMDFKKQAGKAENNPGGRSQLEGQERVLCFDAESGEPLWTHAYDRTYEISYPGGPRCTPTVDGERVYTLGAEGDLRCLNVVDGTLVWSKDLTAEYKFETPVWGFAGHPLVAGDLLYCLVGGEGSVAVAFDKTTGREVWRALTASEPGYCPPTMITHGGQQQLLIWHAASINGLDPKSGSQLWSIPLAPGFGMAIAAPRKQGNLLYACGMSNVAALMKLDDAQPTAEVVWRGRTKQAIYCSNSTPVLDGGIIYGCDVESGALMAARIEDGKRLWQNTAPTGGGRRARHATAFLVKHLDRYFLFNEKGDLIIARLTPQGYQELSRTHLLEPTNEAFGRDVVWSHPAFAQRSVFARNDRQLIRVDLAK